MNGPTGSESSGDYDLPVTTILGLNAYHGDAAAALVVDGELVAAAEESVSTASSTGSASELTCPRSNRAADTP